MQTTNMLTTDYLDILFAHRNKNYGAYELRYNYNKRALKSIAVIVLALILLLTISQTTTNKKKEAVPFVTPPTACTLSFVKPVSPVKIPEATPPQATNNAVVKHTNYVVRRDDEVTDKLTEINDIKDKQIGTKNMDGESTDSDEATTATRKGEPTEEKLKFEEMTTTNAPVFYASEMPLFSGDLKEYLSQRLRYPAMAKENDVQGKVIVQFLVDENGRVAEATVLRGIGAGCDEEALRVVREMPRWKPGFQNGKPVKVYMKIPIVFQLQ